MASLNGYDADKILKKVRARAQESAIDFSKYDSGKTYNELIDNEQDFYYIYFYNRLEEYTGYTTGLNVLPELKDELVESIKKFNEDLDNYAREVAIDVIGEDGDRDFLTFNSAHTTYGYSHLSVIDKTLKAIKEQEERDREAMEEDDYYEVECSSCGDGGCIHCEPHRFI